jgi:hypothetical protein
MGPDDDDTPAEVVPPASQAPADGEVVPDRELENEESREGFDRWRNESAIGGIGTGIARGLQSVFGSPRQEIAIVAEVPGEPPDADTRLRVILDPDDPTKSIAVVPAPPGDSTPTDSTPTDSTPADPPPA